MAISNKFDKNCHGARRCSKSKLFDLFQWYLKTTGINDGQIITVNLEHGDPARKIGLKKSKDQTAGRQWCFA
ncbi:MAG: hypothetical protein LBB08_03040 [Rickettsiales bacterium]|jgi:hypothetical protein|nr:hypothetical protein [Rickettsiales bacterium]